MPGVQAIPSDVASRAAAFRLDPFKVILVGLDTTDGPEHPLYDARVALPLSEPMIESIMQYGVIETVGVTKLADGSIAVVFGRQRVKNAREASRRLREAGRWQEADAITLPCLSPLSGKDWSGAELASIGVIENEIRTADSPLVRASKAAHLVKLWAGDRKQVGRAMGIPPGEVDRLISLHNAHPLLHEAVASGVLGQGAAMELAALALPDQPGALERLVATGNPTKERAREHKRAHEDKGEQTRAPMISRATLKKLSEDPRIDALLEDLSPREILKLGLGQIPIMPSNDGVEALLELLREASGISVDGK